MKVEAAHGGRGNASSHDRPSGFGGGGGGGGPRRGVSRHSEYRGIDRISEIVMFTYRYLQSQFETLLQCLLLDCLLLHRGKI